MHKLVGHLRKDQGFSLCLLVKGCSSSHRLPKHTHILLRQNRLPHLRNGHDVRGLAFRQQRTIIRSQQLIPEMNHRFADILQPCFYYDFIVITRWRLVTAACVDHCNKAVVMLLHVFVGKPKLPQQFDPSDLEPDEVVGMINNSHLIRLRIAYAEASFVNHNGIGSLWFISLSVRHAARVARRRRSDETAQAGLPLKYTGAFCK
jgi:hypothetical protein